MIQQRYRLTIVREREAENLSPAMSMTLTGEMLRNLINHVMAAAASKSGEPLFVGRHYAKQKAWKEITITRL